MDDVLLAVSSPPSIDLNLFSLWAEGLSTEDTFTMTVDAAQKVGGFKALEFGAPGKQALLGPLDLVRCEIFDHFRAFEILEHFLSHPVLLKSQSLVSVSADQQSFLIEKYWSLDESFSREVLNKRLSRNRKDLEDASENTGLRLRSVMRQYDNIKRMYSAYDESSNLESNNMYTFAARNFLLSPTLARKYACIIFLLVSRFSLAAKKRMLRISCKR